MNTAVSSKELAAHIRSADFSKCAATVVGYGNMGQQYVRALQRLGVRRITVCSRSTPLNENPALANVRTVTGGYIQLTEKPVPGELAIIAVPFDDLIGASSHLLNLGYQKILIEKPVSLLASEIDALAAFTETNSIDAAVAYNRVAYPSFHEVRARVRDEGGITSCTYTFTEFIHRIGPDHFAMEELRRWGIANSLHVVSMAHGLIGLPKIWNSYRNGAVSWHPSGAVFVGAGMSDEGIPFAYQADWGSKGRWSVEVHTRDASYRLCPLEKAFRKTSAGADWEELPVETVDPDTKAGFVEQVATMLSNPADRIVGLPSLRDTVRLTRYAEELFGYE